MTDEELRICVRLSREEILEFEGVCLARVVALDHDDRVRRQFSVYSYDTGYVAESVDIPDSLDVRYRGAQCEDSLALYDFFGNEPLANYLYGSLRAEVPGLRFVET